MFDFFKPPTDNLYKFVALSGLLLLVVSLVLPAYAVVNLEWKRLEAVRELNITKGEIEQSKTAELEVKSAKLTIDAALKEADAANLRVDAVQKQKVSVKKLKELKEAVKQLEKTLSNVSDAQSRLHEKIDAYTKIVNNVSVRTIDNEYQGEVVDSVLAMEKASEVLGLCGGILGVVLAVGGFAFWYRKVQVFEDRILKKAAQEVKEKS